jgi:Ca-activated chloride channel family protein
MEFANSYIFIIVTILTIIVGGFLYWQRRNKKVVAVNIPFFDDLQKAREQSSSFTLGNIVVWMRRTLVILAIIFLTIALARPQTVTEEKQMTKNGVDILIALDVSESMLAEDLQPNRMEAAKKYIDKFVSEVENDRVGLEVFAGKPFTQSPMSFDYNVIRYYLSEISTDTIDQQRRELGGTAIGDAIVAAVNRFQNDDERTKVLVLLTDGEANVGVDPIIAAEHARSNGIKVYTVGLGKREGAPLPIDTGNGQKAYARNPDGSLYKTKFDEKTLKDIAQISGGKYFYAGNNESLKNSLDTINALEKTEFETDVTITKEDHFWTWLLVGFLAGLVAVLLKFIPTIHYTGGLKIKVKK